MSRISALCEQLKAPMVVLAGGSSAEREISLKSGAAVVDACRQAEIPVRALDPAERGWQGELEDCPLVFIALHGPGGEDGVVQGALDCLGVTYTGSGVLASALAMDKLRTKLLWRGMGLPTPAFELVREPGDGDALLAEHGQLIVKPATEGSSIGMARVADASALEQARQTASTYCADVMAEQWITGQEYTVAVLGGECLPAIRLEVPGGFYDFEAKYRANTTRYHCPCGLAEAELAEMNALALKAFQSLGCAGWGRVDLMRDGSGEFLLLEVNTIPGLTEHSLVPMAARAAGLSFADMVAAVCLEALEANHG